MKVAAGIASLEHYAGFLRVLYRLHRDIDALYANRVLRIALPDLQEWRRLPAIANQLSALRCALPAPGTGLMDVEQAWTTALGWLFVGEAANLYAIALHRLTCRRGLNGSFGNRYPNKTSEVAMQRWRALNGALDTLTMLPTEEEEVIIGAEHAVRQLNHYVRLESP
ncbi:biliverdin-producing heme oxygenase [Achromobacter pestifer]|nr:biliverdin-producing heme oxygenase [Achromobacter pestifer]